MRRVAVRCLPLMVVAVLLLRPATAEARPRGIVLITHGDTIQTVGEVSAESKAEVRQATGTNPQVGYCYSFFGIFWLDIWTWDGTYCLFEGDQCWVLDESDAEQICEGGVSKPILYTFPPGLMILVGLAAVLTVAAWRRKSRHKALAGRVNELLDDPRYQQALEIIRQRAQQEEAAEETGQEPAETHEAASTTPDDGGFEEALRHLTSRGITRQEAEQNLATLLTVLTAAADDDGDDDQD